MLACYFAFWIEACWSMVERFASRRRYTDFNAHLQSFIWPIFRQRYFSNFAYVKYGIYAVSLCSLSRMRWWDYVLTPGIACIVLCVLIEAYWSLVEAYCKQLRYTDLSEHLWSLIYMCLEGATRLTYALFQL